MWKEETRQPADVLDSWKAIAEYLGRDVRTAIRWERSRGLPVHRLPGGPKAAVYALRSELERWRERARRGDGEGGGAAAGGKPSLAVLPFASLSGDKENEYFSDGLADEIITYLAGLPGMRVTARTSSFAFRGKEEDVRGIGAKLGVEALLEGSVQRAGGRIRVSAQLVSCRDGCHLWSQMYDRELTDIFAVQEQIALSIAAALRLTVAPREAVERRQPRLEAYQLWLQGRHHLFSKRSVEDVLRAGECFARAAALDGEFAAAHLAVGQHVLNLAVLGFLPPQAALRRGRPEIERAIALDERLGEAHAARGVFRAWFDFDWAGAEAAFARAETCEPGSPVIHRLKAMTLLAPLGRLEEAEGEARRALEVDPISPESHFLLALMQFFRREYERAEASIRMAMELGSANPQTLWVAGMVAALRGRFDEAIAQCERAVAAYGEAPMVAAHLGMLYGMAGRVAEARRVLERIARSAQGLGARVEAAQGKGVQEGYVSPLYPALVHMSLGEKDEAFAWLERAVEVRDPHILHLPVKPIYDTLRGDVRFGALLRKMGLAAASPHVSPAIGGGAR